MLFNSYYFMLYFLPLVLAGYYLCRHFGWYRGGLLELTAASFFFYAYDHVRYLPVLVVSILVNWTLTCLIHRERRRKREDGGGMSGLAGGKGPEQRCDRAKGEGQDTDGAREEGEGLDMDGAREEGEGLDTDRTREEGEGLDTDGAREEGEGLGKDRARKGRWILVLGILLNIGSIFYFKYAYFFAENCNRLLGTSLPLKAVPLPLGISFFTFQQISYLVDSYRGETEGYRFIEYAAFVSFFPQLVAGPIVLHDELIGQFRKMGADHDRFAAGCYIFAMGLFKKVMIADTFGRAVAWGWSGLADLSWLEMVCVMLSYTFQIYFDFSGYCDMAIGLGKLFGLDLPVNFASPYKAVSVVDFWKRWHMTLTRFLRNYVYFPLGGSRKGRWRTYGNILLVFLVSGIWHGANWTFILWGLIHGLAQVIERMFAGKGLPPVRRPASVSGDVLDPRQTLLCDGVSVGTAGRTVRRIPGAWGRRKRRRRMKERHQRSGMDLGVMGLAARCRHVFRWACTFIFVDLMWLLFRADSVGQAFFLYKRLLRADSFTLSKELTDGFILPEVEAILQVLRSLVLNVFGQDGQAARLVGALWGQRGLVCMWVFLLGAFVLCLGFPHLHEKDFKPTAAKAVGSALLLVWAVVSFAGVSTFLYFNF